MTDQAIKLVGNTIGDFLIDREIATGRCTRIFKAQKKGNDMAIKVARPVNDIGERQWNSTCAIGKLIGVVLEDSPNPEQALQLEFDKLTMLQNPAIIGVGELYRVSDLCFYEMEYFPSKSLRSIISTSEAKAALVSLARILHELKGIENFVKWGNLKPEHVLLGDSCLKIISPGYFGKVKVGKGSFPGAITSPAYYPRLEPDDLLAFGFIMWEVFTGGHPLMFEAADRKSLDRTWIGESFIERIDSYEMVANYYLSALLEIKPPSIMGIPENVEKVLLRGLRLEKSSFGKLEKAQGYTDFAQIADALETII